MGWLTWLLVGGFVLMVIVMVCWENRRINKLFDDVFNKKDGK